MQMPSAINYTTTAHDNLATTLEISQDGAGILIVRSNRGQPSQPIGDFRAQVPDKLLQPLAGAVSSPEFLALSAPAKLLPGEPYRRFEMPAAAVRKIIGRAKAPPAFLKAEQAAEAVMNHLRQHPRLAALLKTTDLPSQVKAGEARTFWLVLQNMGPTPFAIAHPSLWQQKGVSCNLTATRADVPLQQLSMRHQKFVTLDAAALAGLSNATPSPILPVGNGEQLSIGFHHTFTWPPGKYNVLFSLSGELTETGASTQFAGSLFSGPHIVDVL